jgi:uroporphyrinogen-III synthase
MRLLVTRPEPDADRTARALRARGRQALVAPLLRIEPILDAPIGEGPCSAIAFTSANAVSALAAHPAKASLLHVPVFTVGARTEEAAHAAAFGEVQSAYGDVAALASLIVARLADRGKPLLYLAGEERAGDLAGLLGEYGIAVRTVPIYRSTAVTRLPEAVRSALAKDRIDGVLHFSKRSAEAFLAAVEADRLREQGLSLRHLCLSAEVAAPLIAAGAERVEVAQRSNQESLLKLLDQA